MSHSSLCDRPLQRFAMCTQIMSECSVKVGCKSTARHWGLLSVCRELQQGDAELYSCKREALHTPLCKPEKAGGGESC